MFVRVPWWLPFLAVAGCSPADVADDIGADATASVQDSASDPGEGPDEASVDASADVPQCGDASAAYDGPLCCQVLRDITDDPYWQNCRFGCFPDAADPQATIPWLCDLTHPTTCDDPHCVLGSTCQAFNGYGLVLACDAATPDPVGALCPSASRQLPQ
jgi:hypothetical protein